ncbi:MAG TPA: metallophosphoesterase [Polyangia bacterium]
MSAEPETPRAERRTIFVGDIHGCLDELQDLLRMAAVDDKADRVVLVGDLVAKGPDSQGVLALARERGFQAVLGNHDAKVLSVGHHARDVANDPERGEHARVAATLLGEDWAFLESLPLTIALPDVGAIAVHGGLIPGVPLAEQPRRFLLNLRSIAANGEPSKRVDGGRPWGSLWPGPEHVVYGHDAMRGLQRHPFATGLDTGCVYGGALSALMLPANRIISAPARRHYSPL